MEKHNFVTIADLTREKILYMIEMAEEFEKHPNRELLKGKVVATLFFEPSTRTRLSFETAANRLGARVIGFAHHPDGIELCRRDCDASLHRRCRTVCRRGSSDTYRERRRRSPPASLTVHARPLLYL